MHQFAVVDNCLQVGGQPLTALARAVGKTPFYAYDRSVINARVTALRAALPGVAVTASVDVLPVVREYERSLATILNASVMPAVSTYVARLEQRLSDEGVAAPLLLMQSNGGVITIVGSK